MARFLPRRFPVRLALALACFLVLFVNVGGWYLYNLLAKSLDSAMSERLAAVGETVALDLRLWAVPEAYGTLDDAGAFDDENPESEEFDGDLAEFFDFLLPVAEYLTELCEVHDLRRVALLDGEGRLLIDTVGYGEFLSRETLLSVDRDEFELALAGETNSTVAYLLESVYYKRCYVPIRGDDAGSSPVLVLSVEAGSEYAQQIQAVGRHLLLLGAFTISLGAVWVAVVYRMARRNLMLQRTAERTARAIEMGRMTAGVAHEIRNPLGIIQTNAECLLETAEDQDIRETAEDILEEAERLGRIVQRFSLLGEGEAGAQRENHADLDRVLESVVGRMKALHPKFEASVAVPSSSGGSLIVRIDRESLESILTNLLRNAAESMDGAGDVVVHVSKQAGRAVVTIEDHGSGMSPDEVEAALQPFHTTKPTGTGVGLPLAKRLTEKAGGRLSIESRKGEGTRVTTTFRLWTPTP